MSATVQKRPNFVIILADDMGYGDVGCYGNQSIRTPNIDRLAAEGVRFTDFHSNGPLCSPTRAALVTGRYQQRCGIEGVITAANHRHVGLSHAHTTFASVLGSEGYATALFGKWHLGYAPEFNPITHGFGRFRGYVSGNIDYQSHIDQVGCEDWWQADALTPEDGYTTDLVTEHGVSFINEKASSDQPFCLVLAHECPHYPYQGPSDPAFRAPGDPEPVHGPREDRVAAYKEMIESMDDGIGKVLAALQKNGVAENTLVFFFSDNGPVDPGSTGGLRGRKATVWEGGHRVPAIAFMPGTGPSGVETSVPTVGMDLFPTLLDFAGIPGESGRELDGLSLAPVITGGVSWTPGASAAATPALVGADGGAHDSARLWTERPLFWRLGERKAARVGPWKLVVGEPELQSADGDATSEWLSNLDDDPQESRNLIDAEPEIAADLTLRLSHWEEDVDSGVTRLS